MNIQERRLTIKLTPIAIAFLDQYSSKEEMESFDTWENNPIGDFTYDMDLTYEESCFLDLIIVNLEESHWDK